MERESLRRRRARGRSTPPPAGGLARLGDAQRPLPVADRLRAIAAKHGRHPLRGVTNHEDVYQLTCLRGPSGILVVLAPDLTTR